MDERKQMQLQNYYDRIKGVAGWVDTSMYFMPSSVQESLAGINAMVRTIQILSKGEEFD